MTGIIYLISLKLLKVSWRRYWLLLEDLGEGTVSSQRLLEQLAVAHVPIKVHFFPESPEPPWPPQAPEGQRGKYFLLIEEEIDVIELKKEKHQYILEHRKKVDKEINNGQE